MLIGIINNINPIIATPPGTLIRVLPGINIFNMYRK